MVSTIIKIWIKFFPSGRNESLNMPEGNPRRLQNGPKRNNQAVEVKDGGDVLD